MIQKTIDIDSFTNPLGSMIQQSHWALEHWIKNKGSPEGEIALAIHVHMENEIRKYLAQ